MTANFLIPFCWTLWTVHVVGAVAVAVRILCERPTTTPETGRRVGFLVMSGLALVMGLIAAAIVWSTRSQSYTALATLSFVLAYGALALVASPIIVGVEQWRARHEQRRRDASELRAAVRPAFDGSIDQRALHAR